MVACSALKSDEMQVKDHIESTVDMTEDPFIKKGKLYVSFVENPGNVTDPKPDAQEPDDNHNPKNLPGRCLSC